MIAWHQLALRLACLSLVGQGAATIGPVFIQSPAFVGPEVVTDSEASQSRILNDMVLDVDMIQSGAQNQLAGISQIQAKPEVYIHSGFPMHQLRILHPELCDPAVKQHSGFLDISDGRHLFFWFFEARESPAEAPLMLWMNGGPGCSSTTGLLFELGPCTIAHEGNDTVYNEFSWNQHANMIFLDQPVGTGFSFAEEGSIPTTHEGLAEDIYAFLQLFLTYFPEYTSLPFHLAAESWGGHFGPVTAHLIHQKNQELAIGTIPQDKMVKINLDSLIIVNGLTDPAIQWRSFYDYFCEGGGRYSPFVRTGRECDAMRVDAPICERMIRTCYEYPSILTCSPASVYCWDKLMTPLATNRKGANVYDLSTKCNLDASNCYPELDWISTWMNKPDVKIGLGVIGAPNPFTSCTSHIEEGFILRGQGARNSAAFLPDLVNDGIRLLVFAGDNDGVCNYLGVQRWMLAMEHKYHTELQRAVPLPLITQKSRTVGGEIRTAGEGAGNVAFARIYDAGHMAPHDQPEATQDLIKRWLRHQYLSA